jgi:DNA-binding CsgD family transcriptional regulator
MGTTLSWQGEQRTARPLLEQSLTGWRRIEHAVGTGNALFQLGIVALFERRFADADDLLSQALSLHRQVHSVHDVAYDITMLGFVAVQRGELAAARRYLAEARDLMVGLDDHWGILVLLECTSALAAAEGDAVRALRLVGVASALRDRTGVPLPPAHRESFEPWFVVARRVLPATEAEAATSSGHALVTGQAISAEQLRALLADAAAPGVEHKQRSGALSPREREIAAYVARGWTNQQIADTLIVSRRTVESHVSHIVGKLGVRTRAQVAVWATQHGLSEPHRRTDRSSVNTIIRMPISGSTDAAEPEQDLG